MGADEVSGLDIKMSYSMLVKADSSIRSQPSWRSRGLWTRHLAHFRGNGPLPSPGVDLRVDARGLRLSRTEILEIRGPPAQLIAGRCFATNCVR